jgi:hypothetical protein
MPSATLARPVQRDFSAGMFRSIAPELIPANGAADIQNGLLDEDGSVYRRGGVTALALPGPSRFTSMWHGLLAGGRTTLLSTTADLLRLEDTGTLTSLGGSGLAVAGRPAVMDGVAYFPGGDTYDGATLGTAAKSAPFYVAVANRLLAAGGDRVDMAGIGTPGTFDPTDFHLLPGGVEILGAAGLRDSAAIFTTGGVWIIGGLALNLTDADGNVQQRLDLYSSDLVLWGDAGIAGWSGGLVVPALDAVWLVSLGVTSEAARPLVRLSDPIATLYRDYVREGARPGLASVYRGHYILPILVGATTVDTLVCRLDSHAWTRLRGAGGKIAASVATTEDQPRLLATAGRDVLDAHYFEPGSAHLFDQDGVPPRLEITTRSYPTGDLNRNTVTKLRMTYELQSQAVATIQAWYGIARNSGAEWGGFDWGGADWTPLGGALLALEGEAPEDPEGDDPYSWRVAKQARYIRFSLVCDDEAARLRLIALEVFVRSAGRM